MAFQATSLIRIVTLISSLLFMMALHPNASAFEKTLFTTFLESPGVCMQ